MVLESAPVRLHPRLAQAQILAVLAHQVLVRSVGKKVKNLHK